MFLIQEAIQEAKLPLTLHVAADGDQAVQFFDRVDSDPAMDCPAVVILDINLPKKQGDEVLKHMRRSRKCPNALVIVVSTSDSPREREQMSILGANRYFRKPSSYGAFMELGEIVKALLGEASSQ